MPAQHGRTSQLAGRGVVALALTGLIGCAGSGGQPTSRQTSPFRLAGVANVQQVAQVTGPQSPNRTDRFRVAGTDLGSMFEAGGKVWLVFGDTFGVREPGFTGGGGGEWRSNALAFTTDTNPADGISLDGFIVDDQGSAKELLDSEKVDYSEMTVIPTHGFAANGAMYLTFMSVRHWGEPGEWEVNHAGLAKSVDNGQTWVKLAAPTWSGDSNFVQVSVVQIDDELYFWGVTHGRHGNVALMKVAAQDVESLDSYRYFAGMTAEGEPIWSTDQAAAAAIVEDTVGELSVVWNEHLSRWLMTYTNGDGSGTTIREGVTPWGPWGDGITLVSSADVPGLYSPYMHSRYVTNQGRTIYFTLSVWGPYNVFWYRADLVSKA